MLQGKLRSRPVGHWAAGSTRSHDFLVTADAHCTEALALVMRQFSADLGAQATVLLMHGDDDATCLYSDAPLDVRGLILHHSLAPAANTHRALFDRSPAVHRRSYELAVEDRAWSAFELPVQTPDGRLFSVCAAFRDPNAAFVAEAGPAIDRIEPFLAGFLSVWSTRCVLRERLDGFTCALNNSHVGIVLLDGKGDMVFANVVAERLLDDGSAIRRSGNSITGKNLVDALRLQVAVEHVLLRDPDEVGASPPVVALRRAGPGRPLMISLAGLTATVGERQSSVVLYMFDPDQDVQPLLSPACRLYGLSPVEIRLTSLLVGGACLSDAAVAMRVKEQTARTYLKQIFIKTDVNRQADLVRLMLSSVVPTPSPDLSGMI